MLFENENLDTNEDAETEINSEESKEVTENDGQSDDENSKYAAARREAEGKYNSEKSYWDNFAKSKGFASSDEMKKAIENQTLEEKRNKVKEVFGVDYNQVTPLLNDIIAENPIVKKAEAVIKENEMTASKMAFDNEVEKIKTLNPEVKDFNDVMKLDTFKEMDRIYQQGGKTLSEAYILANFNADKEKLSAKTKQETLNNINSKNHLSGNKQGSASNGATIPAEVLKMYKRVNPGKTDEEYQKHYEKYHKESE